MKTTWQKQGLLYCPAATGRHQKLLTHAANPLPVRLEGDIYRIFYSGRDNHNRSSVGAVDIDIIRQTIIHDHHHPFLEHGPKGSFYADGISIGCCYQLKDTLYMLYMGWQNPRDSHWRGDIGRLLVTKDLKLQPDGPAPLITSDSEDPISLSYPWVEQNPGGGWRMWYGSTASWDAGNGEMLHLIKSAESTDGESWQKQGQAIPFQLGIAQAFSRPTVLREEADRWRMWFSYRGSGGGKYRIGHAESPDGQNWRLNLDHGGINVSATGWDSDMIEYPYVFKHKGSTYMLYNGNDYGKTGFGLAILKGQA